MRSFHDLVRNELKALIILFAVAVGVSAVILVVDRATRLTVTELRDGLRHVNAIVAYVYRSGPGESLPATDDLREASTRLQQLAPPQLITPEARAFLNQPRSYVSEVGTDAALAHLRAIAAALSDRYFSEQEQRSTWFTVFFGVLMVLVTAFLLMVGRTRRRYSRFLAHSTRLMKEVSELLEYQREALDLEPVWEEERILSEAAQEIAQRVQEDREIASEWMFGSLEAFMPRLKQTVERSIPCDRIAVAFTERDGSIVAESAVVSLPEVALEPGFRENIKDTTLGEVAASKRSRVINDLQTHYREVHQSRGTELVLEEGVRASITLPIVIRDHCVGFLFISSATPHVYTREHVARAERLVGLLRHNIYFHYLTQEIVAATSSAFVNLMERKDNETSAHIIRMSRYSHAIARSLSETMPEVTPTLLREILWFAPLHDIGKIGIPDSILLKPGALTDEERAVIQEHVPIGADVVHRMDTELSKILDISLLRTAHDIITGHHEHYNGGGYPAGLAGNRIPIAGRITAIADVFDALTSRRPYKEPLTVERAMEVIQKGVGSQFDPAVHEAFLRSMPEILRIYHEHGEV